MPTQAGSIGWALLTAVIGALPAFGIAGKALFSPLPTMYQVLVLVAYGISVFVISIGGGFVAPAYRTSVSIGMGLPLFAVIALSDRALASGTVLSLALILIAALGSWIGAGLGARLNATMAARRSGGSE